MGHRLTTADILPNQACLCLKYLTEEVFWGQNISLNTKATITIDSALNGEARRFWKGGQGGIKKLKCPCTGIVIATEFFFIVITTLLADF